MNAQPRHKDCVNYVNGYCRLFNVRVNPNDPACPNFRPRVTAYPPQPYPAPPTLGRGLGMGIGLGLRRRRRFRHRHGRSWI